MNYKKAILVVVWSTVFFALLIGILYYVTIARYDVGQIDLSQLDSRPMNPVPDKSNEDIERQEESIDPSSLESVASDVPVLDQVSDSRLNSKALTALASSTYIVGFVGDVGISATSSREVLRLIKDEASAAVILGDFDYADRPDLWNNMLSEELGATYPLISLIGNHDEKKWPEYKAAIAKRLSVTPSISCNGDIGVQSTCGYKDLKVLITAPGITSLKTSSETYAQYISSVGTTLSTSTWNICAWHKNQASMQLGTKTDEAGWDTYTACNNLGFPIMTAHEHSYGRTFLFSDVAKHVLDRHTSISLSKNNAVLKDATVDHLVLRPGKTFVTVSGLGGKSIRPLTRNDPWWSVKYTSNDGAYPGALFCAFNYKGDRHRALCYFKNIKGEVKDLFVMEK